MKKEKASKLTEFYNIRDGFSLVLKRERECSRGVKEEEDGV